MTDPIAIVRMAAAGALGSDVHSLAEALMGGEQGIRQPVALEQVPTVPAGAGEVGARHLGTGPDRAERLLAHTLKQLVGARTKEPWGAPSDRSMLILGTTLAGMRHAGAALRTERWREMGEPVCRALGRTPSGAVLSRAVRAACPNTFGAGMMSLSCACASALSAIAHSCALLRAGMVDAVVAGGYDPISEFAYGGFNALQLVATGPLSPFAKDREGMKLGEGCALVLLRRLADANADGGEVLAVIDGVGEASDAHHLTQPHPDGDGAARALAMACRGGAPDLLIAHATGTPGNDHSEYRAYQTAFGARLRATPVIALKSRLGHPLGAAGALELVATLQALTHGVIPAGAGRCVDREVFDELDLIQNTARCGQPERVTVLAAGFGGANVAVTVLRGGRARDGHLTVEDRESCEAPRILGIGAVCSSGAGVNALAQIDVDADPNAALAHAASLIDPVRTRRIADVPKLMLAAVEDLRRSIGAPPDWLVDTPLIAATWNGAMGFSERYYADLIASGIDFANPMLFAESVPNIGSAHVSLACRIRAASATVVGTRTAGLEALSLACARFAVGAWDRAVIVAADEANPIVDAVISHWEHRSVRSQAAGIAILLGRTGCGMSVRSVGRTGGIQPIASAQRSNGAPFVGELPATQRTPSPAALELGAVGPLAQLAQLATSAGGTICADDQWCGSWLAVVSRAGSVGSPHVA